MREEELSSQIQAESLHTTTAEQLLRSWMDREYRVEFTRERVRSSIALQIRALREQRNQMTQAQLGEAIGMAQTWISKLEDPEYGKMSVATLLRLAEAFDTDLEIKFRPYSRSLDELTKQDTNYFIVPSFEEELPSLEIAAQGALASSTWTTPYGVMTERSAVANLSEGGMNGLVADHWGGLLQSLNSAASQQQRWEAA